ncbi:MAG: hypothetical protein IJA15_00090 [Clostridia bacterium]|nr:hypothetical protein [Clostridia bacterium]
MATYLKRGILCAMALLSLLALFAPFYAGMENFFEEYERIGFSFSEREFCIDILMRRSFNMYRTMSVRGIWLLLGGLRACNRVYRNDFFPVVSLVLTYIHTIGTIGILGLSIWVLIKGDNGLFSKIIIIGSIAMIFMYFCQVIMHFYLFRSYRNFMEDWNIIEKIRYFFINTFQRTSTSSLWLLILSAGLGVGYMITEKSGADK